MSSPRSDGRHHRLLCVASVAGLLLGACDNGSANDNLAIADRFPELPGTELVSTDTHGYCLSDSCPLGDDGTSTLLIYNVVGDAGNPVDIIESIAVAFPDWRLDYERTCLSANPGNCEELVLLGSLTDGEALVAFNFDNWPRRYEIYIDAHDDGRLAG